MVMEYKYIFRTTLGKDPPVHVHPGKIEFESDEKPVKAWQRTCSTEQTDFLKRKAKELSGRFYFALRGKYNGVAWKDSRCIRRL